MDIYLDVLIFLNTFVNFFILTLTSKLCKDGYKLYRMLLAALVGALFSLYIFLPPQNFILENLYKIIISGVIILICFGFDSIKALLRRTAVFFVATFIYGGIMMAVWLVLKPDNLAINNGIVYLDISPIILIAATLISYLIISVIRFFTRRDASAGKRVTLTVETMYGEITVTALLDTGNSLRDSITGNSVIIIEKELAEKLFEILPTTENIASGDLQNVKGFRLLPFSTIGGKGLISAFKPKRVTVKTENEIKLLGEVLVAISEEKLGEDFGAIINPEVLN